MSTCILSHKLHHMYCRVNAPIIHSITRAILSCPGNYTNYPVREITPTIPSGKLHQLSCPGNYTNYPVREITPTIPSRKLHQLCCPGNYTSYLVQKIQQKSCPVSNNAIPCNILRLSTAIQQTIKHLISSDCGDHSTISYMFSIRNISFIAARSV